MSKANAGLAAVAIALVLTNPTVRKSTAKFLDEPRPLPVAPPPMWSADELPDPLEVEQPEEVVSSRLSLKEFQANN